MAVDDEVVEVVEPMAVDDEAPAVPVAESFGEFAPWDAPPAPEPVTDVPVAAASNDELVAAQARIEELQSAVMERAKQRDEMREQLEHAEGRIRQLEGEVSAAQARTDELEQAQPEAAVLGDLAVLEFRGELAPTFGELVAAVAQLEASLAIGEQEKLDARNRITQQEANISELIAQRNEAFGELNVARAHEQELEVELAKLRDELASATDDAGTADDRKAELTRLHAEVDRAEARLRAARTNEQSARDQVEHRRTELGEVQEHLTAARDALRIATSECEATERRLSTARAQAAEAEHARDAARVEAERVIELSMRQAKSLRADAERQAEAARILNDAAREALSLQSDVQQQSQVIRERAEEAAGALRAEVAEHVEDAVEGAPMAPAILSALISRVASIESHLSHQRDRGVEQATPAPVAVAAGTED
jgi:chromosome segregation protein